MTDPTDIDALIAEARGFAAGSESARATLMRDLADALERVSKGSSILATEIVTLRRERDAELRQERERASDLEGAYNSAVERHRLAAEKRDEYQQLYGDMADDERRARAALSRAEEAIEKAEQRYANSRKQQYRGFEVARDMHNILTEYGKQKGADRG